MRYWRWRWWDLILLNADSQKHQNTLTLRDGVCELAWFGSVVKCKYMKVYFTHEMGLWYSMGYISAYVYVYKFIWAFHSLLRSQTHHHHFLVFPYIFFCKTTYFSLVVIIFFWHFPTAAHRAIKHYCLFFSLDERNEVNGGKHVERLRWWVKASASISKNTRSDAMVL